MTDRVLFVDLENVQSVDLAQVPPTARVMIFYGITQKKLPEELVVRAPPLRKRLKWIKISGQGPNALDFHIAFYLGQELTRSPSSECVILSRDAGFDPLIRHLQGFSHACRRVNSLTNAFPTKKPKTNADPFERLVTLLGKEKAHPARLTGLAGKVKSWFPLSTQGERQTLIDRLFKESRVREVNEVLTYEL